MQEQGPVKPEVQGFPIPEAPHMIFVQKTAEDLSHAERRGAEQDPVKVLRMTPVVEHGKIAAEARGKAEERSRSAAGRDCSRGRPKVLYHRVQIRQTVFNGQHGAVRSAVAVTGPVEGHAAEAGAAAVLCHRLDHGAVLVAGKAMEAEQGGKRPGGFFGGCSVHICSGRSG